MAVGSTQGLADSTDRTSDAGRTTKACISPRANERKDCFIKADNAALPFHVFQISITPPSADSRVCDSATSPYYPGTDFVGGKGRVADQDPRYKSYYFHWINRCQYLRGVTPTENECRFKRNRDGVPVAVTTKGNSYEGQELFSKLKEQLRASFSTYARADACTLLQEMTLLGDSDRAIDQRAAGVGLRLYRAEDRTRATLDKFAQDVTLADGTPWRYLVDFCVLPTQGEARNYSGFGLDYEMNDNRSNEQSNALLGEYAMRAHKADKTVMVATNPLPRVASGLDGENVHQLLGTIDYFVIPTANGASPGNKDVGNKKFAASRTLMESYKQQLAVVTQNGKLVLRPEQKAHMIWSAPLYQVSLDDARNLHDAVLKEGYAGIAIFRNYQAQGGACTRDVNQLTACLTMGACDGHFGLGRQ